ncbi:MAG: Smr/MutS family protein [bacterium]
MSALPLKTFSDLDWKGLLDHLADRCQTLRGAERARALTVLEREQDARDRLLLVGQCRILRERNGRISLAEAVDLRPVLRRVEKRGVLDPEDLLAVASTLRVCHELRRLGKAQAEALPELGALLGAVKSLADVRGAIEDCFDDSGALSDHASGELGALRARARGLREEAIRRLKGLLVDPAMQRRLQDDYFTDRDDRYVLPIKAELRHEVPGIVLGSSASGATVFMEPESIIDVNNRIKLAAAELQREERRILAELSALVYEERQTIEANLARLALIDVVSASARLADDLGCGEVTFAPDGQLSLRGLRHPLMVLAGTDVVDNDVELSSGTTLVVTGPNTGGKTVLIKTVGLCALMLRSGLVPSCTRASRIPFYDAVLTDMGDDQSIAASLSTFSAHMTNVGRLLEQAGPGALVLLDEVAVGTDPIQGAALARAIVEALADREAQVLVTTHYPQLKELPSRDARFANASMGFDMERIRPTYRLILNAPGSSSALSVARKLGLPAELLERAAGLLDPAAAKLDRLLEQLEHERGVLAAERETIQTQRAQLERSQTALEQAQRSLEEERRALHKKGYDAAVTALRTARDELERVRRRLRKAKSESDLVQEEQRINRRAGQVSTHAPETPTPPSRAAEDADLVPGAEIWVVRLGGLAKVVSRSGDAVQVQAGALKVRIDASEARVLVAAKPASPRPTPAGSARPPQASTDSGDSGGVQAQEPIHFREPQTTCDLRGLRVDEAEEALGRFLDRMLLEEVSSVLIIHGHGTGALRQLVRQQLRAAPGLLRARSGDRREGGDGVTVAFFQE